MDLALDLINGPTKNTADSSSAMYDNTQDLHDEDDFGFESEGISEAATPTTLKLNVNETGVVANSLPMNMDRREPATVMRAIETIDPATHMHGASPPPKMPSNMGQSPKNRLRWQNGAAVLIQSWQRGTWYRLRNRALIVACRRLYERARSKRALECEYLETQAAHEREINAIEMVLSMEQRKTARLEGAMGEAARKYEQEMASLQQKQRWGTTRGGGGGSRSNYLVTLDRNGKLVAGGDGGGAVPFTVHAQHRARKEAEARLRKAQAKVVHLKNTIKVLLKKLKTNAENERRKATNIVGQIRREMIWHEKRSLSEISRLTGIVDAMGNDPDILRATVLQNPAEAAREARMSSESLRATAKSVAKAADEEEDFILGAPNEVADGPKDSKDRVESLVPNLRWEDGG